MAIIQRFRGAVERLSYRIAGEMCSAQSVDGLEAEGGIHNRATVEIADQVLAAGGRQGQIGHFISGSGNVVAGSTRCGKPLDGCPKISNLSFMFTPSPRLGREICQPSGMDPSGIECDLFLDRVKQDRNGSLVAPQFEWRRLLPYQPQIVVIGGLARLVLERSEWAET
ncbi:MAG TPA: hypothetical protein VIX19_16320 [Terriglobales bacterium]